MTDLNFLEHSEKDQFKNEKAVYIKKGILRVVGEISKIPEKNIRDFFLRGRMLGTDSISSVPGQFAWVSFF